MAQQIFTLYNPLLLTLPNEEINFTQDTFKVMLVTSTYTPNVNTDRYKSAITGEASGSGYEAGGQELENVQYLRTNQTATFTATNPKWTGLNMENVRYAVLYDDTPEQAEQKPLIGWIDFGQALTIVNADLEIVWNVEGIFSVTLS